MSMHKKPLTRLEEDGLRAHGLFIGTPSQLSDAFRQGVAWALAQRTGIIENKSADMEYRLVTGETIQGRFRWTYP